MPLAALPRIAAVVGDLTANSASSVSYRLAFRRDEQGRAIVVGQVESRFSLPCQRCLGEVVVEVEAPIKLGLLRTESAAEHLAEDLDPLVIGDDLLLAPADLIDDELLLAIPAVPRHAPGQCQPPPWAESHDCQALAGGESADSRASARLDEPDEKRHPFAALATLRRGDGN